MKVFCIFHNNDWYGIASANDIQAMSMAVRKWTDAKPYDTLNAANIWAYMQTHGFTCEQCELVRGNSNGE